MRGRITHPDGVDGEVVEGHAGDGLLHGLVVEHWVAPQQGQQVTHGNHPEQTYLTRPVAGQTCYVTHIHFNTQIRVFSVSSCMVGCAAASA